MLDADPEFARSGDMLVVTKPDRLACPVTRPGNIIAGLEAKAASLRIVDFGVDPATPAGKLMPDVLGGVLRIERETMPERQREGIAKGKGEGACKGRKPNPRARTAEIETLSAKGRAWLPSPPGSGSAGSRCIWL